MNKVSNVWEVAVEPDCMRPPETHAPERQLLPQGNPAERQTPVGVLSTATIHRVLSPVTGRRKGVKGSPLFKFNRSGHVAALKP